MIKITIEIEEKEDSRGAALEMSISGKNQNGPCTEREAAFAEGILAALQAAQNEVADSIGAIDKVSQPLNIFKRDVTDRYEKGSI